MSVYIVCVCVCVCLSDLCVCVCVCVCECVCVCVCTRILYFLMRTCVLVPSSFYEVVKSFHLAFLADSRPAGEAKLAGQS